MYEGEGTVDGCVMMHGMHNKVGRAGGLASWAGWVGRRMDRTATHGEAEA